MPIDRIQNLLRATMGLEAGSIGRSAIERAVAERTAACRRADADDYLRHLQAEAGELQELIETVVVPETWFFRDTVAYTALAEHAHARLRAHAGAVLRLLSLPCSSGEEPYSMAMALLDAGIPATSFHIDAVDISQRALERARHAVYGRNSFRSTALDFRDRHFDAVPGGWRLHDAVRTTVRFAQGNLFAADFAAAPEPYDVIFCRNLLIYCDRPTQEQAIRQLGRWLRPDGALFVTPAETAALAGQGFVALLNTPRAYAFAKQPSRAPTPRTDAAAIRRPLPVPRPPAARPTPVVAAQPDQPDLQDVARLADQGRLDEAAAICARHLQQAGPSAQALYLMGLIRDAAGGTQDAVRLYRQALYLDPGHHEALVHLALLLEQQGDAAAAQRLRGRLARRRSGAQ